MTVKEARAYFHLRDDDVLYKDGIAEVKASLNDFAKRTTSKIDKAHALKGVEACDVLLRRTRIGNVHNNDVEYDTADGAVYVANTDVAIYGVHSEREAIMTAQRNLIDFVKEV